MGASDLVDVGGWLVEHRAALDEGEAEWLDRLAEFDRDGLWALDGHFCCANWLVGRTNMARSTAFEKLRVAHELTRRPVIAEAFRLGQLSYSAVRAVTRMDRPAPEVDEALVELAQSGASILDLETVVRSYGLYADQDRPPAEDPLPHRDVRIRRGQHGTAQVVVTLSDLEAEEFAAALQAFIDLRYRPAAGDESSAEDSDRSTDDPRAGDESSREDSDRATDDPRPGDESLAEDSSNDEAPVEEASRASRKADAFIDLVHAALHTADGGHAAGDDRYMVHIVTQQDGDIFSYLDGTPVHPADAATVGCDCSTVTHTTGDGGEPLNLGRKTREWSTAQRRAISVRDGGHCRFPGCQHRYYDIHHMRPWEAGGFTDIANGFCQCRRHHRLLHAGYYVEGDPNGELRFYRPDGTYIGRTGGRAPLPRRTFLVGSR